ncbi:arylacetamide deacetylase-like 4 [Eublepharis macularius]|uniref:Arylacetamide deacetylase-like 4 n=1 Tax=Eublepharis macularius TaxID=481883 RepID=A0AA97KFX7_EUBMA|nr:arylacetamide deacetylase-like 4 [Eublepharis macularius]
MEPLYALLLVAGGVPITILLLSFLAAIYYDVSRTRIPPEFDHPLKLRIIFWLFIMTFIVGKICEFLGICKQVDFIRFVISFIKFKLDPRLFSKDLLFNGVPVRVYQPKAPSPGRRKGLLLFHGGAGQIGSIDLYQDISNKIATAADTVVVSVGYGLSPEHLYPSQYKDCLTATIHFLQNAEVYGVDPSQVVICGDSAGGNFATIVAQKLTERPDLPKLRAQILIYAGVQAMDFNLPSYVQNSAMPLLSQENTVYVVLRYFMKDLSLQDDILNGSHVPDDFRLKYGKRVSVDNLPERFKRQGHGQVPLAPYKPEVYKQVPELLQVTFSSIFAEDHIIKQLPETFIVTCEYDVVRDDNLLYKKRLEDCGVKVSWFHAEQGFHGVLNFTDFSFLSFPAGVEMLDQIVAFVKGL